MSEGGKWGSHSKHINEVHTFTLGIFRTFTRELSVFQRVFLSFCRLKILLLFRTVENEILMIVSVSRCLLF